MSYNTTNAPAYTLPLRFLKNNLGFFGAPLDADVEGYLYDLIASADRELRRDAGIDLVIDDSNDAELLAMYAAWRYRKRDSGEGKPEMLRRCIRNRQVVAATGGAE